MTLLPLESLRPAIGDAGALSRPAASRVKRAIDVGVAALLLLFLAPALALVAAALALEGEGPILFAQRRTGYGGRIIAVLKFRTMRVLEDGDEVTPAGPADPRVTPLGRFLRRTSLDELPQLVNVLKGEMSLVGPRPHALAHDRLFADLVPDYAKRFGAPPGMTGLAQAAGLRGSAGGRAGIVERVRCDLAYIEGWSLGLDLAILGRTLLALLARADGV